MKKNSLIVLDARRDASLEVELLIVDGDMYQPSWYTSLQSKMAALCGWIKDIEYIEETHDRKSYIRAIPNGTILDNLISMINS